MLENMNTKKKKFQESRRAHSLVAEDYWMTGWFELTDRSLALSFCLLRRRLFVAFSRDRWLLDYSLWSHQWRHRTQIVRFEYLLHKSNDSKSPFVRFCFGQQIEPEYIRMLPCSRPCPGIRESIFWKKEKNPRSPPLNSHTLTRREGLWLRLTLD